MQILKSLIKWKELLKNVCDKWRVPIQKNNDHLWIMIIHVIIRYSGL